MADFEPLMRTESQNQLVYIVYKAQDIHIPDVLAVAH